MNDRLTTFKCPTCGAKIKTGNKTLRHHISRTRSVIGLNGKEDMEISSYQCMVCSAYFSYPPMKRKIYKDEVRKEFLRLHATGLSYDKIRDKMLEEHAIDVPPTTMSTWLSESAA